MLDGTHEASEILGELVRRAAAGELVAESGGEPMTQPELLLPALTVRVNHTIERLAAWGLLIA